MEISSEDLARIHQRLDEVLTKQTDTAVDIAKIQTTLELTPKPEKRPCNFFVEHLEEHKKTKSLWQTPLVSTIFDLGRMAVVAGIAWLLARKD